MKKTILVVDDDQIFGDLMRTVFELDGYQAVVVRNLKDVRDAIREVSPALAVMDVHIASGDTLGLLRELRADDSLNDMPVIMTSGMDHSLECLATGANTFLLKPFRPSELMKVVADLLARSA